jgi:hypothetical protein
VSLITTINNDIYEKRRIIRAANIVSKILAKDARNKLAMTSLTHVLMHETLATR